MDKSELYEKVSSAFSAVPYPGDHAIGNPDGGREAEEMALSFRGRDWRSLNPSELWGPALRFMTSEAFHYYFPAFLLAVLKEIELSELELEGDAIDVYDSVISILTPSDLKDYFQPDWIFQSRFHNFTSAQKEVVRVLINLILEYQLRWYQGYGDSIDARELDSLRMVKEYWDRF
jgi:hypothetical protein